MKPKVGDMLYVILEDHAAKNHDDPPGALIFETVGRIVAETDNSYELQYWGNVKAAPVDLNSDITCVVKSAIKELKVLRC